MLANLYFTKNLFTTSKTSYLIQEEISEKELRLDHEGFYKTKHLTKLKFYTGAIFACIFANLVPRNVESSLTAYESY